MINEPYELRRAVVAVQVDDRVVFYYGWAGDFEHSTDRHPVGVDLYPDLHRLTYGAPEYTTTIRWASPPTQSTSYPTDADFARALPPERHALPPVSRSVEQ